MEMCFNEYALIRKEERSWKKRKFGSSLYRLLWDSKPYMILGFCTETWKYEALY